MVRVVERDSPSGASAAMITVATFWVMGAANLQLPLYASYAADAGQGAGALSALLAGYIGGLLPVLIVLGGISDRVGRRPVLWLSLASAAVATALVWVEPNAVGLGVARWFQGISVALAMGSATAWLAETLDPEQGPARPARIIGWTTAAGFGSGALATAARWSAGGTEIPWTYPVWLVLLAASALSLLACTSPLPLDPQAPVMRLPTFPATSGAAAASIGLGGAWAASSCRSSPPPSAPWATRAGPAAPCSCSWPLG